MTSRRRQRALEAERPPQPIDWDEQFAELAEREFDIVVVGGGITGAYAALDAAARGHRVALVEKDDFASGTSSKSSKMVHGGIRYIEQGNLSLVRHSLRERQRLRTNAGHLVQRLPFLFPLMKVGGVFGAKLAFGFEGMLKTYDLSGGWREGRLHEKLTADEVLRRCPTLRADQLLAGYVFYDARADDARLTLAVARTAARHGAVIVNHARVTDIVRERGRVAGVVVSAPGGDVRVSARTVVMATGVWLRDWSGAESGVDAPLIRPAKGVHVAVPWIKIRNESTVAIPIGDRGARATVTRWGDVTYLGTTDDDYTGDLDAVNCDEADMERLLDAARRAFDVDLSAADVVGSMAGCRPLVAARGGETAELARNHEIRVDPDGLVTVMGGKLTTARHMAQATVDAAERVLGARRRSRTARLALVGAAGYDAQSVLASGGLQAHLAERYGTELHSVAAMVADRPELARPLVEGLPYLEAEAVFAIRFELARTVDDVLSRRTRARFLARDASVRAARRVSELVAEETGLSAGQRERQLHDYLADVDRERAALGLPAGGAFTMGKGR